MWLAHRGHACASWEALKGFRLFILIKLSLNALTLVPSD
jgi:hypothetical protein